MEKKEFDALYNAVRCTVHELCYINVSLVENGIRVEVCEKDVVFTFEELWAKKNSPKDFIDLLRKRIWGENNGPMQ